MAVVYDKGLKCMFLWALWMNDHLGTQETRLSSLRGLFQSYILIFLNTFWPGPCVLPLDDNKKPTRGTYSILTKFREPLLPAVRRKNAER